MNNDILLSVNNLTKRYATQLAVDNISFEIKRGSIFGLLGPNGAGKSSLLRTITGIFYPDSGSITFDGQAFDAHIHAPQMGYMPEERGLYKKMKIGEQALYLAQLKGLSRADAEQKTKEWFVRLDMQSWWNKKVEDLSKGMSQKLQFVTTVIHSPKLLILDEPFSGLDPVNADVLKDEIYRLAKEGVTVIFSTHRMEQVEEICDEILLMNQGKAVLIGAVAQVKQDFKENIFRIILSKEPELVPDFIKVIEQKNQQIVFQIQDGIDSNKVLQHFITAGNNIISFTEILPSLNEIFIRIVQGTPTARVFLS